ncbi:helix-turn-helix domain-containing protein [Kitasatospora sp. NBC_00374]|uniref:helix-turn-helix domain-containing protein n=1 Tax=Kitasatospora sp. NBC_00374 TaxID=2975964 RepID=UPI00352E70FB
MLQGRTEAAAFSVLEYLASEAPAQQFEDLVEEARLRGTTGEELERLERLKQLGLSIRSQSRRRQQREAGLSALVDTARDLAMPYDLDTLLKVITRRARLLLGVDMSYISFPDAQQGYIYVRTSDGHTSTLSVGLRLPDGAGLGSSVLANPAPFWTPDYLSDERIAHNQAIDETVRAEGLHAIMGVPLSHRNHPFGVLYVADRNVRHFTTDEIALMSSLGDLAGVAIEKAQLLDQTSATVTDLEQHSTEAEVGLRLATELSELHTRLIDLALSGGDPHSLTREVCKRLGGAIRVYAADGTVLTSASDMPERDENSVVLAAMDAHASRGPVRLADGTWAAPVSAGTVGLGTLFLRTDSPLADRGEELTRVVAQAVAIPLLLENSRTAIAVGHVRDELLDELLANPQRPPQQLMLRARRLGIDLGKPHVVVVARPEGEAQGKVATWASLYAHRMSGLKRVQDGLAVLLLPGTDPSAAARAVTEELTPLLGHPVTVSAAGPALDPTSVFHGHQEALRCLDAMTALGATGRSASARELGFFGVLLADNHDVDGFVDSTIGPVLDYDQQRFTELARTLNAYFETGNSPTYAAQRLHVHTNTVARRLERISELLGPDWQKPERAFEIQLALRLSRIRQVLLDRREAPDDTAPGEHRA